MIDPLKRSSLVDHDKRHRENRMGNNHAEVRIGETVLGKHQLHSYAKHDRWDKNRGSFILATT